MVPFRVGIFYVHLKSNMGVIAGFYICMFFVSSTTRYIFDVPEKMMLMYDVPEKMMLMYDIPEKTMSMYDVPEKIMLMLKIYRPRWTQCDDNIVHDPLGLVMAR
jgi:hypothetical protein